MNAAAAGLLSRRARLRKTRACRSALGGHASDAYVVSVWMADTTLTAELMVKRISHRASVFRNGIWEKIESRTRIRTGIGISFHSDVGTGSRTGRELISMNDETDRYKMNQYKKKNGEVHGMSEYLR
ncbi:hypothetical protein EVAR_24835_1, partial [Eumeta japonica]